MYIFTAKFDKKKAVIAVLLLGVVLCAIVLVAGSRHSDAAEAAALAAIVKNNEQRVNYLTSLGWEVENDPIDEQTIIIPVDFDNVYEEYNKLQLSQGFNLKNYSGLEATRYTYKVMNYPLASEQDEIVIDIIVYRNQIIAGDVQSISLDGFMQGLEFPEVK